MRYEDTSGSFSSAAAGSPDARDDTDTLAAGSRSAATGNAISGEGTITGSAGADIIGNAPGQIVALQGANGSDTADSGGSLTAAGRYGTLTMNQDGGYSYRPNGSAPENARDTFNYTLADASGARDTAMLTIDIGHTPQVAANAQQVVPGPDGVVTLPPGVELSDVHVVGRNLVIDMPDGTQMVIIDGAVFVPQLVLGGVEVPSSNLAALLVDSEPKPAAGTPQSGGGNFAVDVGPLDPGVPLGDLIPPTELNFPQPEPEEVLTFADDEPELIIIPDGQPGAVNAVDQVDESGLPERDGEPEGTLEPQDIETTTGVISIDAEDGIDSVTINGIEIDEVGDEIVTDRGILTITSIDLDSGEIGYSYTATDNTTDGVDDFDDFTIVVTDEDGDTATGTLHIDILDDEPIARDDTDSVTENNPTATGNVMTAAGTTNSPAGADTVGADDATLTAVQGVGPVDTTFDINGNLVVQGEYGTLTIDAEGNYTYQLTGELPETADTDVFTYTLTDGDGDTDTATLTITVPGNPDVQPQPNNATAIVDDDGLPAGLHDDAPGDDDVPDNDSDNNEATFSGTLTADFGDDGPGTFTLANMDGDPGQVGQEAVIYSWNEATDTLTATVDGGTRDGLPLFSVHLAPNGEFEVTLLNNILQENTGEYFENNAEVDLTFTAVDADNDGTPGTLTITFDDDVPTAKIPVGPDPQDPESDPEPLLFGRVDEDDLNEENGDNSTGNDDHLDGDDEPIDASGDSDATTTGGGVGSLAVLFNAGADAPLTFSLSDAPAAIAALEAQNLSSNGHDLLYAVNDSNSVLTAYADLDGNGELDPGEIADGNVVFTLTVNPNGSWSFNLQDQLDHSEPGTEDNLLIDLGAVVVATDADGDPVAAAAGAFVIDVDDDMPKPWSEEDCPELEVVNAPGDVSDPLPITLPDIGADQPAKLTFGYIDNDPETPEEGVVLVADGDPVLDTGGNPVTSGGSPLHYEVIDADTLQAVTEGGDPVFEINLILNPDGTASYTYQQFAEIDDGSGSVSFGDLTGTNAGNAQFQGVGADDPETTVDLLFSAEKDGANDTVNTDNDSVGSQNQSMDAGETVRVDFVQNLTVDTDADADEPVSGFNYGAHVSTNSFTGDIPQVQGEQDTQTVAFTVWALDSDNTDAAEPDRNPDGGFDDADITAITSVTVKDWETGQTQTANVIDDGAFHEVAFGIYVRLNGDGSVTFAGVQQGDGYGISTGSGSFNAVAVQAEAAGIVYGGTEEEPLETTQDSFDLGVLGIGSVDSGEPVHIDVPILVTDADGDPADCDIEITLNPGTSVANAAGTVNEAALDDVGSNPGSDAETVTIDLAASVGGTGPFTFALVGDADHDGVVEGTYGTLTLQPDGHTVVYTLNDPVDDGAGPSDGANPVTGLEDFEFEVTGPDGTTTSTVKITIIDDVPTARDDTDVIDEGDASESGNVISGDGTTTTPADSGDDTPGADGAEVTGGSHPTGGVGDVDGVTGNVTIVGQWGTVVIQPNGAYTYTLSPEGAAALEELGEGQSLEAEVFTYTLTDGDGDESSATLTITPEGANDDPGLNVPDTGNDAKFVDEAGLPPRTDPAEPAGTGEAGDGNPTNESDDSETVTGSFTFTGGDGATTMTINGTPIDLDGPFPLTPIAGTYGSLTITNVAGNTVSYSYTLDDNIDHTDADPNQDDFTIVVDDSDGSDADEASDILTINIVDDVPEAENDTDVIDEGDLSESGNVISGDGTTTTPADSGDDLVGADDSTVTAVSHPTGGVGDVEGGVITVEGQWGTLVMQPNGDYTYTLSPAGTTALNALGAGQTLAAEVFTYTLTDGDDSTDTATLTITPTGANDVPTLTVPDTGDDTKTVYEAGLAERSGEPAGTAEAADGDGTDNDVNTETVTGSFTFTGGDGATTMTINGTPIDLDGPFPLTPIAGTYGSLTITNVAGNTVSYSYTLDDNIDHTDADPNQDDFTIVVDDSDGNDADEASDILTIHIADDTPIAENDTDAIDEGDLSEQGNVITGDGTTTTPADSGDDRVGADDSTVTGVSHPTGGVGTIGVGGNITVAGQWGTLVIEPDGDYTYTLSPAGTTALNALGEGQTLAAEVFTYTLTDSDDSTDTATLTITPRGADDVPTLTVPDTGDDEKRVDEAGLPTRTGELAGTGEAADANPSNDNSEIVSGTFTFTPGDGATTLTIDGAGAGGPLTIPLAGPFPTAAIVGSYGNLVVTDVSGGTVSYTYTLTDNVDHDSQTPRDDFTITVDDSDGSTDDKQTDTLSIHIDDDAPLNYQPDEAIVENSGTDSDTGFLDDDDTLANDGGADSIASLVWNVTDGTNLMTSDTIPAPVTVSGVQVKLYVDDVTGNLIATTDINSAAATVFTATLDPDTSSYEITFLRPLDNGSTSASDFTGAPAGNQDWIGIDPDLVDGDALHIDDADDPNPDSVDLLVTAFAHDDRAADTVNRDEDDIGAGQGQSNGPDETLRIDFVQDLRSDPDQDEQDPGGYNFDAHVGQKVFSFTMVDSQSDNDTAVLIEAFNVDDEAASKDDVTDETNNTKVAIDPATIVVTVGGVELDQGDDYDIFPDGTGGYYLTPIPEGAVIQFQAMLGVTFEAVEITNADGHQIPGEDPGTEFDGANFAIGGFSYGQNDPGDPVEFELPTLLTDGDGDTSSGSIDVTVHPVGQEPAHLLAAQSFSKMAIIDDGSTNKSKTFEAANNNVLLGAVAAAGLASTSAAAKDHGFDHDDASVSKLSLSLDDGGSKQTPIDSRESNHALSGETKEAVNDDQDRSGSLKSHSNDTGDHSLTSGESHESQPTAELLAGTDTPQQDAPAQSILTSQTVAMPTPEMLDAAKGDGGEEGEAKGTGEVGRVLADALAGGDGGKSIDAVIDAHANRGHGADKGGHEALASQGHGDVSHWDTAGLAAFQAHAQFTMETIQLHHDAVQPAA